MRDYSEILFNPEAIGVLGSEYLGERRALRGQGVKLGLKALDEEQLENGKPDGRMLLPLLPGEVLSVLGRPGNGKTGFMMRWARHRAHWLADHNQHSRVVIYITLEQSVEELNAFNVAAEHKISITQMARGILDEDEWRRCLQTGIDRRELPLWFVGYSTIQRSSLMLDIDAIRGALNLITDKHKMKIDFVLVDYLQRIPYNRAESKVIGVSDNLDALATLALQYAVPIAVGVQAKREVDTYDEQVPALDDGQWTSNIEQTSHKILALARPAKYRKPGETFGRLTVQGTDQLVIAVLKQKLGADNFVRYARFNPIYNLLDEFEARFMP